MHTAILPARAVCGVVALVAAVVAVEWPPRGLATSVTATVLMTLFLLAAVAVDWPSPSSGVRVLDAGLSVLALACVAAGVDARRRRPTGRSSSGRASSWGRSWGTARCACVSVPSPITLSRPLARRASRAPQDGGDLAGLAPSAHSTPPVARRTGRAASAG